MSDDGFVIIANVIPNNEESFVSKTGWPHMFYRDPHQLRELFAKAGFGRINDIKADIILNALEVIVPGETNE